MIEHITQEQPAQRTGNCKLCGYCAATGERVSFANAAIQHYIDSQPKPASVEEIMELVGSYWDAAYKEGTESRIHDTPGGDAQSILTAIHQAITQQAEALAQALAEVETLRDKNDRLIAAYNAGTMNYNSIEDECRQLRAQLAALQYDGELPPLPEKVKVDRHGPTGVITYGWTDSIIQDYARQAIANALAKQIKDNA